MPKQLDNTWLVAGSVLLAQDGERPKESNAKDQGDDQMTQVNLGIRGIESNIEYYQARVEQALDHLERERENLEYWLTQLAQHPVDPESSTIYTVV
jgi:hypothetical protein